MTIDYPDVLPCPSLDGYSLETFNNLRRTEMSSGRARQRAIFSDVPVMVGVQWIMTKGQALYFEGWYRHTLKDGMEWFNTKLSTAYGYQDYTCRFIAMPGGPAKYGLDWRYTAQLEIQERKTIDEEWLEYPGYVLGSSVIDLAINEEWPES